jgi:hypothetical protein
MKYRVSGTVIYEWTTTVAADSPEEAEVAAIMRVTDAAISGFGTAGRVFDGPAEDPEVDCVEGLKSTTNAP